MNILRHIQSCRYVARCKFSHFPGNVRGLRTSQSIQHPRTTKDRNPYRGMSPLRRKLPRESLGVEQYGMPEPILDPTRHTTIDMDPNHGLWGFFAEKNALQTPEEDHKHGRSWTVEELRHKSWDDLHRLWWKCVRERNIIETQSKERNRLKPGYGEYEANERKRTVKWTQRSIKHVLTERYYAWQEARNLAKFDTEIDLNGNGPVYNPLSMFEHDDSKLNPKLSNSTGTTSRGKDIRMNQ